MGGWSDNVDWSYKGLWGNIEKSDNSGWSDNARGLNHSRPPKSIGSHISCTLFLVPPALPPSYPTQGLIHFRLSGHRQPYLEYRRGYPISHRLNQPLYRTGKFMKKNRGGGNRSWFLTYSKIAVCVCSRELCTLRILFREM